MQIIFLKSKAGVKKKVDFVNENLLYTVFNLWCLLMHWKCTLNQLGLNQCIDKPMRHIVVAFVIVVFFLV